MTIAYTNNCLTLPFMSPDISNPNCSKYPLFQWPFNGEIHDPTEWE